MITGLALHGMSFFSYVSVLSRLRLSVVSPVFTGATIVLISAPSVLLLAESLNTLQTVGTLTSLVGIGLVFLPA